METLGQRISIALDNANISQRALADQLGIHQGTVSMWVNNKRKPSYPTIIKIADITEVPVEYLTEAKANETRKKIDLDDFVEIRLVTEIRYDDTIYSNKKYYLTLDFIFPYADEKTLETLKDKFKHKKDHLILYQAEENIYPLVEEGDRLLIDIAELPSDKEILLIVDSADELNIYKCEMEPIDDFQDKIILKYITRDQYGEIEYDDSKKIDLLSEDSMYISRDLVGTIISIFKKPLPKRYIKPKIVLPDRLPDRKEKNTSKEEDFIESDDDIPF